MDIKTADTLLKNQKLVTFNGRVYWIRELVIWYDDSNRRQCSFILSEKGSNNTQRVKIEQCEIYTSGCVACGAEIPEGDHICTKCKRGASSE
jgi:hypothetical protein